MICRRFPIISEYRRDSEIAPTRECKLILILHYNTQRLFCEGIESYNRIPKENKMKRMIILFLVLGVVLIFIPISLESVPVRELPQDSQKIKIFLDIAGEDDLIPFVRKHMLEAFSSNENVDVVLKFEEGVSYVISVVLVEARAGENKQKTDNIAACVQYIDYFDNNILKSDVAISNWERVNDLTKKLIEHSQTGLYLFSKEDLGKMTKGVVSKFQERFLEKSK